MSETQVTRRAVTSASNLYRRKLCPGSGREEAKYRDVETDFSADGILIHSQYMRPNLELDGFDAEQIRTLDFANHLTGEAIAYFSDQIGLPHDAEFTEEWEFPMIFHDAKGNPLFPGHADYIRSWHHHNARLISDLKSGFSEQDEAPDNLQLAIYAVMRQQGNPVRRTAVVLVQPRNFGPKKTLALYEQEQLTETAGEIRKILHASEQPNAPLIPSLRACHYCRAKAACPAYQGTFSSLSASPVVAVESLPDDVLVRLHMAISFAGKIGEGVRGEMRKRIGAGQLPAWDLQNSGNDRTLINPNGLWQAMKRYFADNPDFTAVKYDDCREMNWTRLTELVQDLTKLSEKKSKELIEELSKGFVRLKERAKKIVLKK